MEQDPANVRTTELVGMSLTLLKDVGLTMAKQWARQQLGLPDALKELLTADVYGRAASSAAVAALWSNRERLIEALQTSGLRNVFVSDWRSASLPGAAGGRSLMIPV